MPVKAEGRGKGRGQRQNGIIKNLSMNFENYASSNRGIFYNSRFAFAEIEIY
jgi:hypothetical protein